MTPTIDYLRFENGTVKVDVEAFERWYERQQLIEKINDLQDAVDDLDYDLRQKEADILELEETVAELEQLIEELKKEKEA